MFESEGNRSRKQKREGKKEDVGNDLFLWFEQKLGKACDLAFTQGTNYTYTPSVYFNNQLKFNYEI